MTLPILHITRSNLILLDGIIQQLSIEVIVTLELSVIWYCVLQVPALSGLFLVLGLGNTWTMTVVVRQKIHEKLKQTLYFSWKHKYRFAENGNGSQANRLHVDWVLWMNLSSLNFINSKVFNEIQGCYFVCSIPYQGTRCTVPWTRYILPGQVFHIWFFTMLRFEAISKQF